MRTVELPAPVATSAEVNDAIADGAVVVCGVSGGKDSVAAALATWAHLDAVGHEGPRVLMHADLGMVEWSASLTGCQALALHLGCELQIERRGAGGLMERWEQRWLSSVRRYENLETVTLVLPWSTPGTRFCTSELKTQVLASAMRKRWRGKRILNVTGVRRQESPARAKATISKLEAGLSTKATQIISWRPIVDYTVDQVFAVIAAAGLRPHHMYTEYGASRVSCMFCIMSNLADLKAALRNPESHALFRRIVDLEARSTFGFQGARWLGELAPDLLPDELRGRLEDARQRAARRRAIEATIPTHLLFERGWPTRMPSMGEATHLAEVRARVSDLMGFSSRFLDAPSLLAHYEGLMEMRARSAAPEVRGEGLQLDL